MASTQVEKTVYIALGSNLGDRFDNLARAITWLQAVVTQITASPIYETEPWGILDQPMFLNQVVIGKTILEPLALLAYLKQGETELGRTPGIRNGPRVIDMDILLIDNQVMNLSGLCVPHPRMAERVFVLKPLSDLQPDLVIPGTQFNVTELLQQLDQSGINRWESTHD